MIAARLLRARRGTRVACSGAGRIADFRSPTKLAGHNYQYPLVQAALVDVFDQRRDRLVISFRSEPHCIKHMMVHGVVVPVVDATTECTAETGRQYFNTGFDQAPRHQ